MDDLIGEIGKGFIRGIGYILAELFFGTVCYWVGWPVCRLATLGKYPASNQAVYLEGYGQRDSGFWCSAVGFLVIVIIGACWLAGF
jgi:hypothetical protein